MAWTARLFSALQGLIAAFHGTSAGGQEFLIKWGDLGYDECTWESFEDVAAFKAKLEQYDRQKSLEEERLVLGLPAHANPLEALRKRVAMAQRDAMLATQVHQSHHVVSGESVLCSETNAGHFTERAQTGDCPV